MDVCLRTHHWDHCSANCEQCVPCQDAYPATPEQIAEPRHQTNQGQGDWQVQTSEDTVNGAALRARHRHSSGMTAEH